MKSKSAKSKTDSTTPFAQRKPQLKRELSLVAVRRFYSPLKNSITSKLQITIRKLALISSATPAKFLSRRSHRMLDMRAL